MSGLPPLFLRPPRAGCWRTAGPTRGALALPGTPMRNCASIDSSSSSSSSCSIATISARRAPFRGSMIAATLSAATTVPAPSRTGTPTAHIADMIWPSFSA